MVLGITAVLFVVMSLIGSLQVHAAERDHGQIRIVYACDNGKHESAVPGFPY